MSRKALVTEKILGTRGQRRKRDVDIMGGWTNLVEQAPSGPDGGSEMDREPSTGEGRSKLVDGCTNAQAIAYTGAWLINATLQRKAYFCMMRAGSQLL